MSEHFFDVSEVVIGTGRLRVGATELSFTRRAR
jgi:hypothetical protein